MTDVDKNLIKDHLEEFKKDADKWFEGLDFLKERYEFFQNFFSKDNLKKHEWEDFQKMGDNLHSMTTNNLARKRGFGKPNHDIKKYRDSFYYLAYGDDPIVQRIDNLVSNKEYRLLGIGRSSISEIVGYLFPQEFTFYNSRSKAALKILEITLSVPSKATLGSTLKSYSEAIKPVYDLYTEVIGKKTDIPLSFEIDQFFSYLSENYETEDEVDAVKTSQNQFSEGNKFWTYSPGEGGSEWPYCLENSVAVIMWNELGDLSDFENKETLKKHYKSVYKAEGSGKNNVTTCWNFANTIKEGDIIFAKAGRSKLLGVGRVVGDYQYSEKDSRFYHYRKVEWLSSESKDFGKSLFAIKTLTDVTKFTDFVQMLLEESGIRESNLNVKTSIDVDPNLNSIFYGPPGTGKTYEVRKRAVEIIEGEPVPEEEYLEKYENYLREGRIKFITFHPNYGYENFVEGIFPVEDNSTVSYETSEGSFKQICREALKELIEPRLSSRGFDHDFELAYKMLVDEIEENSGELSLETQSQGKTFVVEYVEKTDGINVCPNGGRKMRISKKRLKEIYVDLRERGVKDPKRTDVKFRSLRAYTVVVINLMLSYELSSNEEIQPNKSFNPFDELESGTYKINENSEPYVLTKRIGAKEELYVELPISKSIFGVPSNLYILGTMNTADRSVEALDIALRRRFDFESFYPKYDLKELSTEIDGVKMTTLLDKINLRIEALKDSDHTIGHSYFFGVKSKSDLVTVFKNKVVPLLQEYFFDDWEKIGLILGDEVVVNKKSNSSSVFAKFKTDIRDSYSERKLYTILDFDEWLNLEGLFLRMAGSSNE